MNDIIKKIARDSGFIFGVYLDPKESEHGIEYCDFTSHEDSIPILQDFTRRLIEEYIETILDDESGDIDYIKWRIRKEIVENGK